MIHQAPDDPLGNAIKRGKKFNLMDFICRFIFGAIFGAVFGFFWFAKAMTVNSHGESLVGEVVISAVAFGFASGIYGDRFWKGLINRYRR